MTWAARLPGRALGQPSVMIDLGHLQRSDPSAPARRAALDDDPFWSVVRRRHPEAEVVLVPPPPGGSAPPTAVDVLDEHVAALGEAWRAVAPITAAAGGDGPPSISWRARAGGHALVAQKALRGIGIATGLELLRAVAATLGGAGWLLRPSGREDLAVLDGRGGLVDLRAEAGRGATVLTLATGVVAVGSADRARIREEARAWR